MYACFEQYGIPRAVAEPYYKKVRVNEFWLKDMIGYFKLPEAFYEDLIKPEVLESFVNQEVINIIKGLGKENCLILTHGGSEWQMNKIKNSGIADLFTEIVVVFNKKAEALEEICSRHRDEKVLFTDDKQEHFDDIDLSKCPNLETILFDDEGLEKLKRYTLA